MWVLLTEYNDYDQHGAYFVAAYKDKPSTCELKETLAGDRREFNEKVLEHIRAGGGRIAFEDQWFRLIELEEGLDFHTKENGR